MYIKYGIKRVTCNKELNIWFKRTVTIKNKVIEITHLIPSFLSSRVTNTLVTSLSLDIIL